MTAEKWVAIQEYEGLYAVSDGGHVRSMRDRHGKRRDLILRRSLASNGYLTVALHKNGVQKTFMVHRLVARAFLGDPGPSDQVNHIDADKANAALSNIEYCTASKNRAHSFAIGNESTAGDNSRVAKLNSLQVAEIRSRAAAGEMQKTLAGAFGVTQSNISQICSGKRWAMARLQAPQYV